MTNCNLETISIMFALKNHKLIESYTLKLPGANDTWKWSIGVKLNSGSMRTQKSVNLPRNMTQTWASLTQLFVKSEESWPIPGHFLTRKWVRLWWIRFRVTLIRVCFRVCWPNSGSFLTRKWVRLWWILFRVTLIQFFLECRRYKIINGDIWAPFPKLIA